MIAFHLLQILCSALGWRVIAGPTVPRVGLLAYTMLRWIREAVNNLLPLAQIGGEIVVARLLQQRGMKLAPAIAGTVADLTIEMATQILFTLLGLILLLSSVAVTENAAPVEAGTRAVPASVPSEAHSSRLPVAVLNIQNRKRWPIAPIPDEFTPVVAMGRGVRDLEPDTVPSDTDTSVPETGHRSG